MYWSTLRVGHSLFTIILQLNPQKKLTKKDFRDLIREKFSSMSNDEKMILSKKSQIELLEFLHSRRFKNILMYFSLPDEVDTQFFLKNHFNEFNFYLPKVDNLNSTITIHPVKDLEASINKGSFNIGEPNTEEERNLDILDCIVVPGRAMDIEGNRVGRGKGYYDRFLSKFTNNKTTIACLLFHFQFIPEVPSEKFDVPIEYCITNKGVFHLRKGKL